MRRIALVVAVFVVAAVLGILVVRQFPREEQASFGPAAPPAAADRPTPPLAPAPTSRDGVLEVLATAGGEPVAGAEVRLYAELPPRPGDQGWRLAGRAQTGTDGLARFFAGTGTYLAAVRARGLAPGWSEAIRPGGETATRVAIALAPPAALAGRTFARDGGAPVRARVAAIPSVRIGPGFVPPRAPPEEMPTAIADANGAFRLEGLAPGLYAVEATAEGRQATVVARVAVPRPAPLEIALDPLGAVSGIVLLPDGRPAGGASILAAGRAHDVETTAGPDGRFAFRVPSGRYLVLASADGRAGALPEPLSIAPGASARSLEVRLGPAAAIEGTTAATRSGRAVPGAEVAISPHETGATLARTAADRDGRFRLEGLAPGSYDLRAEVPGLSPARLEGITLGAGQRFPLSLAFPGTGVIEGSVRDEAGAPLAGVHVRVVERGDGLGGAPAVEARTGYDGRYRIERVEVGRADLVAHQDGVAIGAGRSLRVQEGRTSQADFFLPEAGILAGRVDRGEGAAGALMAVAVPMRAGLGAAQVARAPVDATGNYRLVVPAGEYRVHAAPAEAVRTDLRVAPSFARVVSGRTTRLDLRAAPAALEGGLAVEVFEPGGAPSSGAVVTISRAGDDRIALATSSGEDGVAVLGKDLGIGQEPITVRARNGGRGGAWTGVPPAEGTIAVSLAPGASVEGRLRAPGRPIRGFTLEVSSQPVEGGWRTLDVHRFAGDRFELGDLPAEPVRLAVRTQDGRRGAAEITLRPGEQRTVDIALETPVATGR